MVHVAEGGLREVRGDTSVAVQAGAVATVDARARVALVEELEKVEAQRRAEAASIPGSGGAAVGQVLMPAGGRAVPWCLCAVLVILAGPSVSGSSSESAFLCVPCVVFFFCFFVFVS